MKEGSILYHSTEVVTAKVAPLLQVISSEMLAAGRYHQLLTIPSLKPLHVLDRKG